MALILQYKLPFSLTFQEEVQFTDIVCDNGLFCYIAESNTVKLHKGTIRTSINFLVTFVVDLVSFTLLFRSNLKITPTFKTAGIKYKIVIITSIFSTFKYTLSGEAGSVTGDELEEIMLAADLCMWM